MFVAPSIAVAVAQWPLLSRCPTPSLPPPCCCACHAHRRRAVHCHCRLAVHQRHRRRVAIASSVTTALPSRHPLPLLSPSRRPSTLLPLCHHRRCAVHRRCCYAVHHHCCHGWPSTPSPSCHRSAFCGRCGMTLLRNGRCRRAVHHLHRHYLTVMPSIAVAVTPSITVVATTLPARHPSPSL
jgi:hypothetical protein